jgi:hypothetical protein
VHDALPFRVFLLHDALRLPYDVVPHVHDALLPCGDALLLLLTYVFSYRLPEVIREIRNLRAGFRLGLIGGI